MNAWRQELSALLREMPCRRPAALRRSLEDGWLYASDLPRCAEPEAVDGFRHRAAEKGWRSGEAGGWILLTREVTAPPPGGFAGPFGEEAACCRSLLERHRDGSRAEQGGMQEWLCRLVRAGEEGPEAYEQVCLRIHQAWAEALRKGRSLPEMDPRWFGGFLRDGGTDREFPEETGRTEEPGI